MFFIFICCFTVQSQNVLCCRNVLGSFGAKHFQMCKLFFFLKKKNKKKAKTKVAKLCNVFKVSQTNVLNLMKLPKFLKEFGRASNSKFFFFFFFFFLFFSSTDNAFFRDERSPKQRLIVHWSSRWLAKWLTCFPTAWSCKKKKPKAFCAKKAIELESVAINLMLLTTFSGSKQMMHEPVMMNFFQFFLKKIK